MKAIDSFKAVIFDMDGLMIDTERLAIEAWQQAGQALGITIDTSVCISMIGRNNRDSENMLVEAYGPNFPLDAIRVEYPRYHQRLLEGGRLIVKPGLVGLLDYLDTTRLPTAVGTSTERTQAQQKLRLTNLLDRFSTIITGDQVQFGKPAPDIFLMAASALGVKPAHCLVLEDSEPGIRAAHAAGMTPIMVPDIKPPSPEIHALAYRICASLAEVESLLRAG